MTSQTEFTVRYWGATGSLSRPLLPGEVADKLIAALIELSRQDALGRITEIVDDPQAVRQWVERRLPFHLRSAYGGNTSCVEIQTPDALLILDAGSGLRELGVELERRFNDPDFDGPRQAHVLLTHAHMDHTYATPFFDPYYDERNDFTVWAPPAVLDSLEAVLGPASALRGIFFPPSFDSLPGLRSFRPVEADADFYIGATRVTTFALNHPGGCLAYRLKRGDRALVFASDHEHTQVPDVALATFAAGADLLYMDAQYWQDEYDGRRGILDEPPQVRHGWGHSTVEACIPTALAAGARHLHLGHHEPKRNDEDLARLEAHAQRLMQDALAEASRGSEDCQVRLVHEGLVQRV